MSHRDRNTHSHSGSSGSTVTMTHHAGVDETHSHTVTHSPNITPLHCYTVTLPQVVNNEQGRLIMNADKVAPRLLATCDSNSTQQAHTTPPQHTWRQRHNDTVRSPWRTPSTTSIWIFSRLSPRSEVRGLPTPPPPPPARMIWTPPPPRGYGQWYRFAVAILVTYP